MAPEKNTDAVYDASTLGTSKRLLLGVQHLFAMFGATVLVPALTGLDVANALLFAGLGTLLFYRLCQAEKEAGARYMSLFTGEKNPARHIYERAGFEAVRTFGILRKAL